MDMALKQIKAKIKATDRTRKVTRAMEAVSAVKMRQGQERAFAGRAYADAALRILTRIAKTHEGKLHPLMSNGTKKGSVAIIVITSDKGLAGSLNSAVLKSVNTYIRSYKKEDIIFLCLGRKGYEHFSRRGYEVVFHYTNISDDVSLEDLEEIASKSLDLFRNGNVTTVAIAYQNFISTFLQEALVRQVFPIDPTLLEVMIRNIIPAFGKFSEEESAIDAPPAYTVEPESKVVLDELLPRLAHIMIYHAMLESKASEHSARMVAMKNASDKARDVSKTLNLVFNKARQAAITREVSEITGGIEAMANH